MPAEMDRMRSSLGETPGCMNLISFGEKIEAREVVPRRPLAHRPHARSVPLEVSTNVAEWPQVTCLQT